jgi:aldehyde:ferredoxin oxidoreductase
MIGSREPGLGELLAQGSRRAAGVVGGRSIDFAPQVKGLELPGYEPRTLQAMALGWR